jgi:hypothetical protein
VLASDSALILTFNPCFDIFIDGRVNWSKDFIACRLDFLDTCIDRDINVGSSFGKLVCSLGVTLQVADTVAYRLEKLFDRVSGGKRVSRTFGKVRKERPFCNFG